LKGGKTTMRKKLSMFIVSLTILTALVGTSTAFAKTTPQPTKIIVIQPMRIEPPM
jgi:ABC-type glycerol-3-phosphate transport system substrate-binding protein